MKEWKYFGIALLAIITPISSQQGYNYPTPSKPFNGGASQAPVDYTPPTNGYPSSTNGSPHPPTPGGFPTPSSGDFSRPSSRGYPSSTASTSSGGYPTPTSSSYPDVTQNGYPSHSNGHRPGGYSSQGGSSYPAQPTGGYPSGQNGFRDGQNGHGGSTTPKYSGNGYSSQNGYSSVPRGPTSPTYTSSGYPASQPSQGGPSSPTSYPEQFNRPSQNQGQFPSPSPDSTEYPSPTVSGFPSERPTSYQNGQTGYSGGHNGHPAGQNSFPSSQNGKGDISGQTRQFIEEFEPAPEAESSSPNEPDTNEVDYSAISGQPDVDYPILASAPETSFRCDQQQYPGYYADLETRCQVFHICTNNKTYDFLCPNGTIFHQEFLVCVWWHEFDCNSAPSFYGVNADLYDYSFTGAQQQTGAIPAGDDSFGGPSREFEQNLDAQTPTNGHGPGEPVNGQASQGKYEPQGPSSQQVPFQSTQAPRRYEGTSQGYPGSQLQRQNGHQTTQPPERYDGDIQGYPGRQSQSSDRQYIPPQSTQLPGRYDKSQGYPEQRPTQSTQFAGQNGGYHDNQPQGSNGQQRPSLTTQIPRGHEGASQGYPGQQNVIPSTQPPRQYQSQGANGRHRPSQTTQTPERYNGVSEGYPSGRPYEDSGQQRPIQSTETHGQYPEYPGGQPGQQPFQSGQAPKQYKETSQDYPDSSNEISNGHRRPLQTTPSSRNGYLPPRPSQAPGDDRYSTNRPSPQQNGYSRNGNGHNGQYPASETSNGGTYPTTQGPRIPTQIPARDYLPPLRK
ncbi:trithorax group protein osa-like [Sitophilus oryzae]|uniref:Trithorax group protein osa-like n=1 Tax=Sitophilus oryzae TaxID=7048 RepID=A0A6J2XPP9_SITOR|nr:trithorax group protein osa-like [Sitophilus oryzae]